MIARMLTALAPVALLANAPPVMPETAILAAMTDSAAGWNAGDLGRFVAVYADDAVYVTGKGLVRGRAAIADRYRKSFVGTGNARGRLTFVEPVPTQIRLLEVQTTAHQVWVHGAVPTVRADGSAGREHVLFTSAPWAQTLHCDREKDPRAALAPSRDKVRLAVVHKPKEPVE